MAVSIDTADTPALVTQAGIAASVTSASFTPPPGSLVVVLAVAGWSGATQAVITCSDSGSHTWTNSVKATGTSSNGGTASIFQSYFATSPGPITVSTGYSGFASGSGGIFMDFAVLMGAAANQSGAATNSKLSTTGLDGTFSLTTTKKNSWIWGCSDDSTNGAVWTPASGVNQWSQWNDVATPPAGDNVTMTSWYVICTTTGSYTVGGTYAANGATNHTTQQCAVEILPASDLPIKPVIINTQAIRSAYM